MSATPHIPYLKTQITNYTTLITQLTYRIARLKSVRKTTKRAQYINYHQIQARRNLLADYINCLNYYQNYLDLLSSC